MTALVNKGKEALRDALQTIITQGGCGRDGSPTTITMTELVDEVLKNPSTPHNGDTVGQAQFRFRLTTAEGNGNTLREAGLFDASDNLIVRKPHSPIEKNATFEMLYIVNVEVKNV